MNKTENGVQRHPTEEELQALHTSTEKFFSVISHDLRNPVTFIVGFSQLLLEEVETLSREEIKAYATNINRSAKNLANLLENLLQWAEFQRGRIEYRPKEIDLTEIVRDNIELLQGSADEKQITLLNDTPEQTLVFADRTMINSVVQNLISNAVKFSHPGGQVKITSQRQNNFVELSVSDNGIGMGEETIAGLFRSDTQQSRPGTAGEKGTGLGLMLCKEFIEKNNGKIWVDSTLNKGATFTVAIPTK